MGKRNTDAANEHSYKGYRVFDFGIYQIIAEDWTAAIDVKNILDANHAEFVSYWSDSNQYMSSNPRTIYATLTYSAD